MPAALVSSFAVVATSSITIAVAATAAALTACNALAVTALTTALSFTLPTPAISLPSAILFP